MTSRRPGSALLLPDWLEGYRRAWVEADADLAVTLFTEDASYLSSPFRQPFVGHEAIREYWRRGAGSQQRKTVRIAQPFLASTDRAVVEWWATMIDDGQEVTLPGVLLLRFRADGRCHDLREYWHVQPRATDPYPSWGS